MICSCAKDATPPRRSRCAVHDSLFREMRTRPDDIVCPTRLSFRHGIELFVKYLIT
jgi:hypothetical protein